MRLNDYRLQHGLDDRPPHSVRHKHRSLDRDLQHSHIRVRPPLVRQPDLRHFRRRHRQTIRELRPRRAQHAQVPRKHRQPRARLGGPQLRRRHEPGRDDRRRPHAHDANRPGHGRAQARVADHVPHRGQRRRQCGPARGGEGRHAVRHPNRLTPSTDLLTWCPARIRAGRTRDRITRRTHEVLRRLASVCISGSPQGHIYTRANIPK
ncbi:hypothetical protein BD413DRAFT_272036 [Trametes elegans]|nr:hypothetical protein BD413DRAFT_272036 [Trametes elegans]